MPDDSRAIDLPAVPTDRAKRQRRARMVVEAAAILLAALVVSFLLKTFVVQSYYVPSASMENTLQVNDQVLVPIWSASGRKVTRGDVIVFRDPGGWLPSTGSATGSPLSAVLAFVGLLPPDGNDHLVKRVIGIPGDTVACCSVDGRLVVNGTPISEPYAELSMDSRNADRFEYSVTVPAGMLWVLGDNRFNSADSAFRFSRHDPNYFVPETNVVGVPSVISWPISRWRRLDNYPDVFAPIGHPAPAIVPQG